MTRTRFQTPKSFRLLRRRLASDEDEKQSHLGHALLHYFHNTFLFFYLVFAIDCLIPANEIYCGANVTIETNTSLSHRHGLTTSSGPVLYACNHRLKISNEAAHYLTGTEVMVGMTPVLNVYKYVGNDTGQLFYPFNFWLSVFFLSLTAGLLLASLKNEIVRMFIGILGPVLLLLSLWLLYF